MASYRSKKLQFVGSSYEELATQARREYHRIQSSTPRRVAYARSNYFKKDKVFIGSFWEYLNQKPIRDRRRRLKLFACAIDLIRNTRFTPQSRQNPNNADELLHRFFGITRDGLPFYVQIKENKKTNRKDFISVFPARK